MDRLAEQVVAWHNRHPLAKRITIYDVHTIGVVALPFMRSGGSAASADPVEPVLTDEVSPDSLAAAWGENDSTLAVNPNAAHLDALADQEELPAGAKPTLAHRLGRLAFWRRGNAKKAQAPLQAWPAFSERFVGGLSPRRIAHFARNYGYTTKPGDASWPQRVVAIDDAMMAQGSAAGGSWPFELYLMSAAVDAGSSRTRVLVGHGQAQVLLGKRCLSPLRVGLLALVLLGLAAVAGVAWWPHGSAGEKAASVEAAASAASAPEPLASAPAAASAVRAEPLANPASAPEMAASEPEAAASMPAAEPASAPAIEALPRIRPQIALPARPPKASDAAIEKPAEKSAEKPVEMKAAEKAAETPPTPIIAKPAGRAVEQALAGKPVVALVGPVSPGKAEAEALLERMRQLIAPTQADPKALQGQVFQTSEGWRAAVWPFASREEAQLINATLVARGMRTRAVDF